MRIPRIMSTQHPDNVRAPFFSNSPVMQQEDEVKEAFYAFSHLKIEEQLWDCEGKEVDSFVVKKLLTRYEPFFSKTRLGRERFLTLRVPNPNVERTEAKVLLETLESIPRSFDIARTFYGEGIAPIFEVAVPMASGARDILRVSSYYRKFVCGKQHKEVMEGDVSVAEWIGPFSPEGVRVIPLFEDKEGMLNAHLSVREFVEKDKVQDYQRVWLARSDPALNYGNLGAVLLGKTALQRLSRAEEELSVDIYPIIGCGSAPFRGNFTPSNAGSVVKGYPSVQTFTAQSAFKYDYPEEDVRSSIEEVSSTKRGRPLYVDEDFAMEVFSKTSERYQNEIREIAGIVNDFAPFVPKRRLRKLHIGLFGYSRSSGDVKLPRAITFCAALYSLGFPPEVLGMGALREKDVERIPEFYPGFLSDLGSALRFLNKDNLPMFPRQCREDAEFAMSIAEFEEDHAHKKVTSIIRDDYAHRRVGVLEENVTRAAWLRQFLG